MLPRCAPFLWMPLLVLAVACSGGEAAPEGPWQDLNGTLYVLDGLPGEVWQVDPRSGARRSIGELPAGVSYSKVIASPDGAFLLVGIGALSIVDLGTGAIAPIAPNGFTVLSAALSPSNHSLAVVRSTPAGYVIERADIDGGDVQLLYGPDQRGDLLFITFLGEDSVLFARRDSLGAVRVWAVEATASQPVRFGADTGLVASDMAGAPTGARLAVASVRADGVTLDVREVSSDGHVERLITTVPGEDCVSLAWSPDEQYLALVTLLHGRLELVLVHVATGEMQRRDGLGIEVWEVSWSARPWSE